MKYPSALRSLLGTLPFGLHIDGLEKLNALRALDLFFHPTGARTVTVGKDSFALDTSNPNERIFYYLPYNLLRHARQTDLYGVMQRVLRNRSGTFADVGASMGLYSYLANGLGARTLLFEPEPAHHAFLQRNAHIFGEVFQCALSGSSGKMDFHVGDVRHAGASSLVMPEGGSKQSPYQSKVEVELATFDDALESSATDPSDTALIKIDVEGHEVEVLRGMSGYLSRPDAAPVWCEVRSPASDRGANSYAGVTQSGAEHGYQPFRVEGQDVHPFRPDGSPLPQVFDLLLLVPERHGALFNLACSVHDKTGMSS